MATSTCVLRRYHLLHPIGRGGMGEVYLARDTQLGRLVAIKRLRRDITANRIRHRRLIREAQLAAQVDHPAAIRIYDIVDLSPDHCGHHGGDRNGHGGPAIVMEYVEGDNLHERILRGPLSMASEVLPIAWQIAGVMAAVHDLKIIHRDLKPANVLITPQGNAKVTDFGIATVVDDNAPVVSQPLGRFGTLSAMSPEQLRQEPLDTRTDLFSFGILLYQMIARTSPFASCDTSELCESIAYQTPEDVRTYAPDAPPLLSALIAQLMQKSPSLRPRNGFREVQSVLQTVAEQIDSSQRPLRYHRAPRTMSPDATAVDDMTLSETMPVRDLSMSKRELTDVTNSTRVAPMALSSVIAAIPANGNIAQFGGQSSARDRV